MRTLWQVLSGITLLFCFALVLSVIIFADTRSFRKLGSGMLLAFEAGCVMLVVLCICVTLDPSPTICVLRVYTMHLGLFTALASLTLCLYRLDKIFNMTSISTVKLLDSYLLLRLIHYFKFTYIIYP